MTPREPLDDAPPQLPRPITPAERSRYLREHRHCPRCGEFVLVAVADLVLIREEADDRVMATTSAICLCGWKGLMDRLLP